MKRLALALFVIVTGAAVWSARYGGADDRPLSHPPETAPEGPFDVIRVVDGDTLHVDVNGVDTTVRLIGVDTPERGDCWEDEATAALSDMLSPLDLVWLEADDSQGDVDRYGRALRFVWLAEQAGLVNRLLIQNGDGREYTYDEPYRYRGDFVRSEAEARDAGAGLWSACDA